MGRTGAMKAFIVAYVVVLVILALLFLNTQRDSANVAFYGGYGVLVLVVIVAAAMWPRALRTPWFWLVGTIPGLLFFLLAIHAFTQIPWPPSTRQILLAIGTFGSFVVLVLSAVILFRQARRL